MSSHLSAVIITKNEEKNIKRCLESLTFCDEIVVVDSGSTDSTCEIAQAYGARVFHQEWLGYAQQKNFANGQASGKWILSIDADEEVSDALKSQILQVIQSTDHVAFKIPRKTFHSGQWIKHGGWFPNALIRLFQKSAGSWQGNEVHESFMCSGKVGSLSEPLYHHSFSSFAEQVKKNNDYSSLGTQVLVKNGKHFSLFSLLFRPPLKFFETFILKRGFLDGMRGYIISVMAAHSVFLKWAKLWEWEIGKKEE